MVLDDRLRCIIRKRKYGLPIHVARPGAVPCKGLARDFETDVAGFS